MQGKQKILFDTLISLSIFTIIGFLASMVFQFNIIIGVIAAIIIMFTTFSALSLTVYGRSDAFKPMLAGTALCLATFFTWINGFNPVWSTVIACIILLLWSAMLYFFYPYMQMFEDMSFYDMMKNLHKCLFLNNDILRNKFPSFSDEAKADAVLNVYHGHPNSRFMGWLLRHQGFVDDEITTAGYLLMMSVFADFEKRIIGCKDLCMKQCQNAATQKRLKTINQKLPPAFRISIHHKPVTISILDMPVDVDEDDLRQVLINLVRWYESKLGGANQDDAELKYLRDCIQVEIPDVEMNEDELVIYVLKLNLARMGEQVHDHVLAEKVLDVMGSFPGAYKTKIVKFGGKDEDKEMHSD